jgi:transportin-1
VATSSVSERDILSGREARYHGCRLGGATISLLSSSLLLSSLLLSQPQPEGLQELAACLQQTTLGNSEVQAQVREVSRSEATSCKVGPGTHDYRSQRLERFNQVPDYNKYLVYILVTPVPGLGGAARGIAGIILQNNIRIRYDSIPADSIAYIRTAIWTALQDAELEVRRVGTNVVNQIVQKAGPETWPDGLLRIVELMDSPNQDAQEVRALPFFPKFLASGQHWHSQPL